MSNGIQKWIESSRGKLAKGSFREGDLEDLERLLTKSRQRILYLLSQRSDMRAPLCGWRLYDPEDGTEPALPSQDAPYGSVLDAVRAGWRVMQVPSPRNHPFSEDNTYVGYEFVLERSDQ